MHRILVTNDDGVYASGLQAAAKSVQGLGEVIVAAPSGQMSGVGRSISVFEPLRYAEVNLNGFKAYAVTGTPVDSVIIGIFAIMKASCLISSSQESMWARTSAPIPSPPAGPSARPWRRPATAFPAIAASIQAVDQGDKFDMHHGEKHSFDVATKILRRVAAKVLEHGLPKGVDRPEPECAGQCHRGDGNRSHPAGAQDLQDHCAGALRPAGPALLLD